MANPHKLSVKIGGAEFSSEGDEQTVKDQFAQFLAAIATTNSSAAHNPSTKQGKFAGDGAEPNSTVIVDDDAVDRVNMNRIFAIEANGLVSLKAMPKTEHADADGLLMILYGFQELGSNPTVYSPTMMKAARKSGIQTAKISIAIAPNRQYVNTSGIKRAAKYSLNNKGIARAKELIDEVLAG